MAVLLKRTWRSYKSPSKICLDETSIVWIMLIILEFLGYSARASYAIIAFFSF